MRNGDHRWVRRNAAFTPLRVKELVAALQPQLKVDDKEKVEKVIDEAVGSTRAKCVKLRTKESKREVCVGAATGLLLRVKNSWENSWRPQREVDYGGYSSVADKQFPRNIRISEGGKLVAEFSLDSVSVEAPDKSLFEPLPGAAVWPVCDESKLEPPVPVYTPDPTYPDVDRRNKVTGIAVVQAVIDEQGQTHDVVVVRSLTPGLDEEARAAVLKWRFKPALCGSTPIPTEMHIEVAFRLF